MAICSFSLLDRSSDKMLLVFDGSSIRVLGSEAPIAFKVCMTFRLRNRKSGPKALEL